MKYGGEDILAMEDTPAHTRLSRDFDTGIIDFAQVGEPGLLNFERVGSFAVQLLDSGWSDFRGVRTNLIPVRFRD